MNASLTVRVMEIIIAVNFLLIIAVVYIEKKKPSAAAVWVLILSFLPAAGIVLYLIFGRNLRLNKKRIFKNKKEYDLQYNAELIRQKYLLDNRKIYLTDKSTGEYLDIIEMHLNASRSIYSQDNSIIIFTEAKDKYSSLIKDIEAAQESIHLLYFIINNDNIGRKIVDCLTNKARQGVSVRLLYDHIGSLFTPFSMFNDLIKAGGKVYRFFPLRLGTYLRINFRNHRKIVVIDGRIGYTGGMNIGDEYMSLHKRKTPWRDTHIRITGSSVHALQERFLSDWYYTSKESSIKDSEMLKKFFPEVSSEGEIGVQVVSAGPDSRREQIKLGLIKVINSTRKFLYIQSPYFVPDEPFLEALQIAAMSGVDVRIMLPSVPDKKFVYRVTFSYIQDLIGYGIRVYLYPGFLHSKMLVMDGKIASLGTTNIDIRSFSLDFEINVFVYNTSFSEQCAEIFEKDMEVCRYVTEEWYRSRSFLVKAQEGFFRLFSPLM
ncbi:cardiolipin synthase [Anaerobacterium chartisolvens]|uniref:Cardiolipin synthase n=1 Tax=Anaerobacterium chartisolvens TaxID=1297424 RepID=A0A369B834_9FIRM|nr:cardiolipin synthase [Anaerobacterium chartisolvens]RCX17591.1 cardiolipin synthase [Anaerobacterium chartisolvens]